MATTTTSFRIGVARPGPPPSSYRVVIFEGEESSRWSLARPMINDTLKYRGSDDYDDDGEMVDTILRNFLLGRGWSEGKQVKKKEREEEEEGKKRSERRHNWPKSGPRPEWSR